MIQTKIRDRTHKNRDYGNYKHEILRGLYDRTSRSWKFIIDLCLFASDHSRDDHRDGDSEWGRVIATGAETYKVGYSLNNN
jgi:hypothetical protein